MKNNKTQFLLIIFCLLGIGYLIVKNGLSKGSQTAYLDTNILIEKYEGAIVMRHELDQKAMDFRSQADTVLANFRNQLMAYEEERKSMTAKEQQLKEELLRNEQQKVAQYKESIERKIQEEEQLMMQSILNAMNDYTTEYGKKMGYDYILGANGSGSLVYANNVLDITEEVLAGLNAEYNK